MPKNKVIDPITDQEIAFARLILSGAMTDRRAAEAVGLNPNSAAYTKAKPRVRAYMLEHRAAVQQQLVQQEVQGRQRFNLDREQVLSRLWEIANLSPEMTRNSVTGQVKALSMIVAMQNFIPDRLAAAAEKKSAPAPAPQIYTAAWLREQQAKASATTNDPQPTPAPAQEEAQQEDSNPIELSSRPERSVVEGPAVSPGPNHSPFANLSTPAEAPEPYDRGFSFVPDARAPFSIPNNPSARRR